MTTITDKSCTRRSNVRFEDSFDRMLLICDRHNDPLFILETIAPDV